MANQGAAAAHFVIPIGKIEEYHESENLENYIDRLKQYLEVNEIPEQKKVAVLLSVIGAKPYAVLKDILSPEAPNTKSFDELVTTLTNHFAPKPLVIAERYKFHSRNQKDGEPTGHRVVESTRIRCG